MLNKAKLAYYTMGVALSTNALVLSTGVAHATSSPNNFGTLASRITTSLADLPGLLSALCYLFGVLLVILGIIKIKEHVEKPDQTPVREGATRLIIGGMLFALPTLLDIVKNTTGTTSTTVTSALVQKVSFSVGP
jgi:hypothetical protein